MPKFSANLSMMFTEYPFLARFEAAKKSGFDAVEFLFPYAHSADEIGFAVQKNDLQISVFNLPPGDWEGGDRGTAALSDRKEAFRASIAQALPYAKATGAKRLHVMAGLATPDARAEATYIDNIHFAADQFAGAGLELLIEPINPRDMPGYFLSTTDQALALMARIDHPAVRLQFDVYHHQITRGDVIKSLSKHFAQIGHIQIASVPERQEPDRGELNYQALFAHLDHLGYDGWLGCEYHPRGKTEDGLSWLPSPT